MKSISFAVIYMNECQAIFHQEHGYCEVRAFQDKQKNHDRISGPMNLS